MSLIIIPEAVRSVSEYVGDGIVTGFTLPSMAQTPFGLSVFNNGLLVSPSLYTPQVGLGPDLTSLATVAAISNAEGTVPGEAIDNNLATFWSGPYAYSGQWYSFDFGVGNDKDIIAGRFFPSAAETVRVINGHDWQYSLDGIAWFTVDSGLNNQAGAYTPMAIWSSVGPQRYWRFLVTSIRTIGGAITISYSRIVEIELYEESVTGGISGVVFDTAPTGPVVIEYLVK